MRLIVEVTVSLFNLRERTASFYPFSLCVYVCVCACVLAGKRPCIVIDGRGEKGFRKWRKTTVHPINLTKKITAQELLVYGW